jgi:aminopeptidase N
MKKYFSVIYLTLIFISLSSANCNYTFKNQIDENLFRDSVDVINYQINLKIGDYYNQKIDGNTVLTLKPVFDNTKTLKLDLLGLIVDSIEGAANHSFKYDYANDIISINFNRELSSNDTAELTIYYHGTPKKDVEWGGFYFTKSDAFNMGVGMGSNPPNFGRVWFPCIDNFTDRATYEYNITVAEGKKAICSGVLTDIHPNENNTVTYTWKLSQTIPTYLSSVAVSDYSLLSIDLQGMGHIVPFQAWVYTGYEEKAKKTFVNIERTLQIFESFFGEYCWDKIGYVQTGFASGAMEHATNISLPYYAINGTLENEMLIVHEFAHSWFGNLVTCETTEDMWLNEGWASYCEAIFVENMYGNESFKNYVRKNHLAVLTTVNIYDGDFYGIYGIPDEITYGKTVYDKGASVIHSLRNYIGDELFFISVKKYLSDFKFNTANTQQFKDSLSSYSNINLTDFFDFYVKEEGFNHFSINQYSVVNKKDNYYVSVKVKQRLIESDFFAKSNKVEITFMDNSWNSATTQIFFSGETGDSTYILDFEPEIVILDIDEKIMDATTDCYKVINKNGYYNFESTNFSAKITDLKDSVFIRVQNNQIEPENSNHKNYILSNIQFWTIDCILNNTKIEGKFYFTDDSFFKKYLNRNKVLLFRKNSSANWDKIDYEEHKNYLEVKILQQGEYVFAVE